MSYTIHEIPGQEITEPVTLEYQKAFSNIDDDYSVKDSVLLSFMVTARQMLEKYLNIGLVNREIEIETCGGVIELPLSPNFEIISVMNGVESVTDYTVNGYSTKTITLGTGSGNWHHFYDLTHWKYELTALGGVQDNIPTYVVRYNTGYKELPNSLRDAICVQVDFMEKNRGMPGATSLCAEAVELSRSYSRNLVL